jgi:cathepsin D
MAFYSKNHFFIILTLFSIAFNFYHHAVECKPLEFEMELNEIKQNKISNNSLSKIIIKESLDLRVLPQEVLTIKICLGSPQQCFNVIYDTGSYHLWLASYDSIGCASCKSFDYSKSKTFEKKYNKIILNYLTGTAKGWEVTDYLKIDENYSKINWLLAEYVVFNVEGADGIIGFARDYEPSFDNSYVDEEFSFIESLYLSNTIDKRVFSQNYTNKDLTKAKLYIGEYTNDFSSLDKFTYCNVIQSDPFFSNMKLKNLWACRLSYLIIGNPSIDEFYINSHEINTRAVFDSGSNYIMAPMETFPVVKEMFRKFVECGDDIYFAEGVKVFSCAEHFDTNLLQNFSFIFNGYAYTVPSNKLFKEFVYYGKKVLIFCIIFKSDLDFWLLGQYFLRNFHILFDNERNIIGFNGEKEYITDFTPITDDNDFYLSDHWEILLIVIIFTIMLVGFGGFLCYKRYRRGLLVGNNSNLVNSGIVSDNYYNRF